MTLIYKLKKLNISIGVVLYAQFWPCPHYILKISTWRESFRFLKTLMEHHGLNVMFVFTLFTLIVLLISLKPLLDLNPLFVPFSLVILTEFFLFCSAMKRKRGGEKSSHKDEKLNQWDPTDMAAAIQGFFSLVLIAYMY